MKLVENIFEGSRTKLIATQCVVERKVNGEHTFCLG